MGITITHYTCDAFHICFFMLYVNMQIELKVHTHESTSLFVFSFEKNESTTILLIYMPPFNSGFRSADQAAA